MGLFWGPRATPAPTEERGISGSWGYAPTQYVSSNFASIDVTQGETSLQSVAVGATVDLICSLGSELPVGVYTDNADGTSRRVPTPANLLDPAGDGRGLEDWISQLLVSWLLRGNAYGEVTEIDVRGNPRRVNLIYPDDVAAITQDGAVNWFVQGKPAANTFRHYRVNPLPGRILGQSAITRHAATVGVSLTATQFGKQWFGDGAHPSALLINDAQLDEKKAETAKTRFLNTLRGTREPLVLGKGWDYKALSLSPEESQFLETQKYSEAQCARIFGPGFAEILGYESGGSMTYSNIVDRRQDLLVLSMNRWIRRFERVLSTLVPPKQYVRMNRDALLEATTLERYQAHALALGSKWRTVNEIRALEDLLPVPWGDDPPPEAQTKHEPEPDEGVPDGESGL